MSVAGTEGDETVRGRLTANRAAGVTVCASHIGGSVSVANSTGPVLIGDGGDDGSACGANTVGGTATLHGNAATVTGTLTTHPLSTASSLSHMKSSLRERRFRSSNGPVNFW